MKAKTMAALTVLAAGAAAGGAYLKKKDICPLCVAKKLAAQTKLHITAVKRYDNGVALTPPMGWSSWNTFRQKIDEQIIRETAAAMKACGLVDAGYQYLNLDDCWQSSIRDAAGRLQGDLTNFPSGIKKLVEDVNAQGLKLGLYTSNGTLTCEDLPASLGHEETDARTLAEWGVEYFKYDFCHNVKLPSKAPCIDKIMIGRAGERDRLTIQAETAVLEGEAHIVEDQALDSGKYVAGLDANQGSLTFQNVEVEEAGEYVLTIGLRKKDDTNKFCMVTVNGTEHYHVSVPATKSWSATGRIQVCVQLRAGGNTIKLHNPVASRFDSAALQYENMGRMLKKATREYAQRTGQAEKPIVYSICEWGWNKPYRWGREAGNLWRTTPDIQASWLSILGIYEHNVKLHEYAGPGGWNDPDMLEVGNGNLTFDENKTHFTLWCMMAAPLILGNDIRKFIKADGTVDTENKTLAILTNREVIAIDQDPLGVQCRRVRRDGLTDILVKPLENGELAVCFFNKGASEKQAEISLRALANESFVSLPVADRYEVKELWTGHSAQVQDMLAGYIPKHGVKLFRVRAMA